MAGIYIHIPFCKSRCVYCDFFSSTHHALADAYVDALLAERVLRWDELRGEAVHTLYLGGGTPSQLTADQLLRLLTALRLPGLQEITVEVNPDDVTAALASLLVQLGVNRVSMGVQSFVDSELRFMRRRHSSAQALRAVDLLRHAGVTNVSIDMIYGVPGQTLTSWAESVDQALSLDVQHLSAYNLTYEENTPLTAMWRRHEFTPVDDDDCVAMYGLLRDRLSEAGYEHYEISNFARPGYRSRHNSSYWDGTPYLGLGAAAHSYDGEVRRSNPRDLSGYIHALADGRTAFAEERLTEQERYDEMVMLGLRTAHGVDVDGMRALHPKYLSHFLSAAAPHLRRGNLRNEGSRYILTPRAVMLSDSVISDLFW